MKNCKDILETRSNFKFNDDNSMFCKSYKKRDFKWINKKGKRVANDSFSSEDIESI